MADLNDDGRAAVRRLFDAVRGVDAAMVEVHHALVALKDHPEIDRDAILEAFKVADWAKRQMASAVPDSITGEGPSRPLAITAADMDDVMRTKGLLP